jgi:hypothetical protein
LSAKKTAYLGGHGGPFAVFFVQAANVIGNIAMVETFEVFVAVAVAMIIWPYGRVTHVDKPMLSQVTGPVSPAELNKFVVPPEKGGVEVEVGGIGITGKDPEGVVKLNNHSEKPTWD